MSDPAGPSEYELIRQAFADARVEQDLTTPMNALVQWTINQLSHLTGNKIVYMAVVARYVAAITDTLAIKSCAGRGDDAVPSMTLYVKCRDQADDRIGTVCAAIISEGRKVGDA